MRIHTTLLLLSMALASSAALAGKPDWAGKGNKNQQAEQAGTEIQIGAYFGERQRLEVSNYYETQGRAGKCPPGLAKKHNGCQPPGQAKKWQMGRPLERDVVFYPVPNAVVVRIGLPPAGYRYVRVLNDVLLVAIASNIVVDAIEDLMR
jgi:Ni/Co efflux regulator RcnB